MGIEEDLIEQFNAVEYFVDGFCNHVVHNGVMSCVGYRTVALHSGSQRVVVVRLVWPAGATEEAIADAKNAQSKPLAVCASERVGRH